MSADTLDVDEHMEELLDQGLGMEETDHGLLRRPSLKENYHGDCLLAPDTDFVTDDCSSAASGLDVADRLTYLEQRMQMQEDEIQLLKMALADVLKRLNISEEHQAAAASRRPFGAKARPVSLALPSRPPMVTSSIASLKKSAAAPSSAATRNYSPTPSCSVKSPPGSVKDSPCKTSKPRPTSAASSAPASIFKKPQEGTDKSKEAAVSAGTRRVTHCKVTMQIYLSPLARKTGSFEYPKSATVVPDNGRPMAAPQEKMGVKPKARKSPQSFTLNLQKTTTSQSTVQDSSTFISPIKSPSQYFQICY